MVKIFIIILLLWSGMLVGISFLESWVKFRAPTLTKAIGLDVGRTVFNVFHKVQFGLLTILIILGLFTNLSFEHSLLLGIVGLCLLLQVIWLFPKLNKRADLIIKGLEPPKSHIHAIYGILEIIKLILMIYLGFSLM